jgi:hypothetical protein
MVEDRDYFSGDKVDLLPNNWTTINWKIPANPLAFS